MLTAELHLIPLILGLSKDFAAKFGSHQRRVIGKASHSG
jgi:hypothetical protein